MDEGFVKGQSDNLPPVSIFMVAEFIKKNKDYSFPESRTTRSLNFDSRKSVKDSTPVNK